MKILSYILVVAYAKRPCSLSSCLVCETSPYRRSEICEVMKPCCEDVKKYLFENKNQAVSNFSPVSKRQIETENSMPVISSLTINIGTSDIVSHFPKHDEFTVTPSPRIFLFICIFCCFIVACRRYLKFLKSHWTIY